MLEDRCVPATWIGAVSSDYSTPANWSTAAVPGPLEDLVFDGHYSNNDCVYSQAMYSQMANSVTMQNSYSGTLHLQTPGPIGIGNGGITQSSGDIEADLGQDIEVGGDYNWSGGSIDVNSPFIVAINMYAAGKDFNATGNGTTGANIVMQKGTTLTMTDPNGTSTFTKGAGIDVKDGAFLNCSDGTIAVTGAAGVITIESGGTMQKSAGGNKGFTTALAIQNSGTFQLLQGLLTITGTANDTNGKAHGYYSAGTTDLTSNTSLVSKVGDVWLDGGVFWTEGPQSVGITADVVFNGGTINLNHSNQTGVGLLTVVGNVNIQGSATWVCKVDCSQPNKNSGAADTITASAIITLGGKSTFQTQAYNVPLGGLTKNDYWSFLIDTGNNAIAGNFGNTNLGTQGWTAGPGNIPSVWRLQK